MKNKEKITVSMFTAVKGLTSQPAQVDLQLDQFTQAIKPPFYASVPISFCRTCFIEMRCLVFCLSTTESVPVLKCKSNFFQLYTYSHQIQHKISS